MPSVHSIVFIAKKKGRLTIKPCSECGSRHRIEAHHDDYSKPLDVRWLCKGCHRKWHSLNNPIGRRDDGVRHHKPNRLSVALALVVAPDMQKAVVAAAKQSRLSVGKWIRLAIERALERKE